MGEDTPEPANKTTSVLDASQPLWLPEGSVRAILAVGVVFGFLFFEYTQHWAPEALSSMAQLAFGVYVGGRLADAPTKK